MASSQNHATLSNLLGQLAATGWQGFEGLVTTLLREITGQPLILAGSGLQGGLDAATPRRHSVQIAVECKRYGASRPLSVRELRAEIDIACNHNPELDCWILVASREVTTQEDEALAAVCDERGIAYLSLGTASFTSVGLLDALCAAYADTAVAFFEMAGHAALVPSFRKLVSDVKSRSQYRSAFQNLTEALDQADIGYGSFVRRLNKRFVEDVGDKVICQRRFRCALTPASLHVSVPPIRRVGLLDQLQASWIASQPAGALSATLVLGEEGSGKSWVVTDWLCDLAKTGDAPAIFYVPASEPKSNEAATVLEEHARLFALTRSTSSSVRRKLQRWLSRDGYYAGRRAIVILDGINERPDAGLWADLIEELASSRMLSVHLVVTCRSLTWNERFRAKLRVPFKTVVVGDFSESEFTQHIAALAPENRAAIRAAGQLVRRPRYFHLAVQRAHDLPHGGELTAEVLYYWDWQHRELLRRDLPVDSTEFSEVISRLARDERAGQDTDRAKLEAVLGVQRFVERQGELASSSVIERTVDGWRLKKEYFALGLGMYLAARLEDLGGSIDDRCAAADDLIGDTSALDLTTSVLQHAMLHTLLSTHRYDRRTQIAVLSVWAGALNATSALEEALPNLPLPPGLLFDFADHHWRQEVSAHVMEQAVLAALIRSMKTLESRDECAGRLMVWASFVHEHAESEGARGAQPGRLCADVTRLCGAVNEYSLPVSKIVLRRVKDQSAVRLGRLAIAAVSAAGVRQYWRVVETAFVADQAMDGPRTDSLAWLVRWCHDPLDELVDRTSARLLLDDDPVSYRAAQRIISALGCQALLPRLTQIPKEHFPIRPWAGIEDGDPCKAFFSAPTPDELPACLARTDVPLHLKVERAGTFAADTEFPFPNFFGLQVTLALEEIDASGLCRHMGMADGDHTLSHLQPLGFRLALPALTDLLRRLAFDCAERSGMPLRQASFLIEEFSALLDEPAIAAIHKAWDRIVEGAVPDLKNADFVESLFATALLGHMESPAQLDLLRRRGGEAMIPDSMVAKIKQVLPEQQVLLREWASDSELLFLALRVQAAQKDLDTSTTVLLVQAGLASEHSVDRGVALSLLLRLPEHLGRRLLHRHTLGRDEQATPYERYFRTIGAVTYEEPNATAICCVSAEFLGQALLAAPIQAAVRWAPVLADLLSEATQLVLSEEDPLSAPLEVDSGRSEAPWRRIASPRSRKAHRVMFSSMSTWGGLADGDLGTLFSPRDNEGNEERDLLEEALSRASASGDWLYGAYIPAASIKLMAENVSAFQAWLERILSAAIAQQRIFRLQALFEAALGWGFTAGHSAAFDWYDELESAQSVVKYKDRRTGLLSRHAALVRAQPSAYAQARWRDLIHAQASDSDLHRVLSAIANSNGPWLLDEAERELASGSPRGRAMALVMASVVDDPEHALASMQRRVCGECESWYDSLAAMAWQYVRRARAQRHWLKEALLSDDPHARVRGAALLEYLGHPTLASEIHRMLESEECAGIDGARSLQLPTKNGHNREWSEWTKNMDKRLLGSRVLEHVVSPWLPHGVA